MKDDAFYSQEHYPRVASGHGWYRTLLTRPRLNAILQAIEIRSHNTVLEVGCESGVLVRMLEAHTGASVYGIDINKDSVRWANHPRIHEGNAQAIPFPDSLFDACVSSHTIEHLESPEKCLAEVSRVLKDGGKAVFIYPWELFRGMVLIPELLACGRIPFPALLRRIHRQLLNPKKIEHLTQGTSLLHVQSKLFYKLPNLLPQYLTVFQKKY